MDAASVRELVAARGVAARSVVPLGAGHDNEAFEVDGTLVVRFARTIDPDDITRQAQLLDLIAALVPLPIPKPVFTVPELGCLAYRKLPGTPLLELPASFGAGVAGPLGTFLAALNGTSLDRLAGLAEPDDQPLDEWLGEATELYGEVVETIPPEYRPRVEAFLATTPPPGGYSLVFSHNDLGIEHVLVAPATGAVTGVIDWGDAALVDPAYDFALIHRDLGPAALDIALRSYGTTDQPLRARAVFYARCGVLEDLAYGVETSLHRYTEKSLAALSWLFPA